MLSSLPEHTSSKNNTMSFYRAHTPDRVHRLEISVHQIFLMIPLQALTWVKIEDNNSKVIEQRWRAVQF